MNHQNVFIQKRILPEVENIFIQSFCIKELEINSLIEFMDYLEDMNKWADEQANFFPQRNRFSDGVTIEDISLFRVDVTFIYQNQMKLHVAFLSNLDLFEFISSLEIRIIELNLHKVMESKGVPLGPPS
jgi:hypothetical protein